MMYIEAIQTINNLKFSDFGNHKKVKYKDIEVFSGDWKDITLPTPPKNDSRQVRMELDEIKDIRDNTTKEQELEYINTDENPYFYIQEYMEKEGLEYDEERMVYLGEQVRPIIRHYKNMFDRPRPYQIAKELGIDFDRYKTETSNTPSYPSGHTVQPKIVANYYATIYPEHKDGFFKGAEISGLGRVRMGVHFPSDIAAGHELANKLMRYLKFDMMEDAPVNATGSAVVGTGSDVATWRPKKKRKLYDVMKRFT